MNEIFGKLFQILKPQWNITILLRNVIGFKDVIPDTQANPKIDSGQSSLWNMKGMMPQVHDWIIENVFEWAPGNLDISMIQMTNRDGYEVYNVRL